MAESQVNKSASPSPLFGQGRANAYYTALPVSLPRFGLYVIKEKIFKELASVWHVCAGRPGLNVKRAAKQVFFWQHWLFLRGGERESWCAPTYSWE